MRLIFEEETLDDLQSIFTWIAKDNPRAAERLINRILLKLDTGGLPNDIPTKVEGGFGDGVACDGCGEQISASQAEHDFTSPDGRVMRLHITCSGVWQAEVLKRHAERSA